MDFHETLNAIIEEAHSDMKEQYRQYIDPLIQSGANSFETLTHLARDEAETSEVRRLACWLLGQLRQKRAASALLSAFTSDDIALYWEAAMALRAIKSKRARKPLEAAALSHPEENKRVAAIYALGGLTDKHSVDILLDILNNEQELPRVRGEAAEALSEMPHEDRIVETLISRLQDPTVDVRFWSVFALAHQGDPRAIPALEEIASHSTDILPGWWEVSKEAQWALMVMNEPDKADEYSDQLVKSAISHRGRAHDLPGGHAEPDGLRADC